MAKSKSRSNKSAISSISKSRDKIYNAFDIAEASIEEKNKRNKKKGKKIQNNEDEDYDSDPLDGADQYIDSKLIAGQKFDEDEDEEIDSDEAFGSSEEDEILDSKKWREKRKYKKGKKPNASDSEAGSDDDFSYDSDGSIDKSQLVSLTEAWDMDDKDQEEFEKRNAKELDFNSSKPNKISKKEEPEIILNDDDSSSEEEFIDDLSESESGEEQNEDEDEELSLSEDEDYDDIDEEKFENLQNLISSSFKNKKQKSSTELFGLDDFERVAQTGKVKENEAGAGSGSKSESLTLESMISSVQDDSFSFIGADSSKSKKSTLDEPASSTLSVPLPRHIQQRLDRKAAYDLAAEEVNKWEDTVESMKVAQHLQFPMNPPKKLITESVLMPTKPEESSQTEMEKKIEALLKQSGLTQESASTDSPDTFDKIAPAQMTLQELQEHRSRLRRMKELAYREEKKARRIKKIKSKTYHKIHRKEREREADLLKNADISGDEAEDSEDQDIQRARARMEQRHKTTNNKWARDMIKHGMTKDVATRSELEDMLRRNEALRQKILGKKSNDSDGDFSGDEEKFLNDDDEESEDDEATIKMKEGMGKGVLAMKFMRDAEEAERKKNKAAKEELRRSLERANEGADADLEDLDSDGNDTKGANVVINAGRRIYAPGTKESKDEADKVLDFVRDEMQLDEEASMSNRISNAHKRKRNGTAQVQLANAGKGDDDEEEEETKSSSKKSSKKQKKNKTDTKDDEFEDNSGDEENPWLAIDADTHKKKTSVSLIGRDTSSAVKAQSEIKKQRKKANQKAAIAKSNGLIDMENTLSVINPFESSDEDNNNNNESSEDEFQKSEQAESKKQKKSSLVSASVAAKATKKTVHFKQTDLVKEAFAGDDVVEEFIEEKEAITMADDDKVVDATLPGWGSWGGTDIDPSKKKRFTKKIRGVVKAKNRKDSKLQNVIINENPLTKDQLNLFADKLPFPFENRAQYDRSLRIPIGQEWTSRTSFQKLSKPRVLVKPNLIIEPLRAPFKNDEDDDEDED